MIKFKFELNKESVRMELLKVEKVKVPESGNDIFVGSKMRIRRHESVFLGCSEILIPAIEDGYRGKVSNISWRIFTTKESAEEFYNKVTVLFYEYNSRNLGQVEGNWICMGCGNNCDLNAGAVRLPRTCPNDPGKKVWKPPRNLDLEEDIFVLK